MKRSRFLFHFVEEEIKRGTKRKRKQVAIGSNGKVNKGENKADRGTSNGQRRKCEEEFEFGKG